MTTWQRLQFWMLGRAADQIFFSIEPWAQQYASWFPGTPVHHLPVGSNIPACDISRRAARERLGFDDDQFVAGIFGTLRGSRPMPFLEHAITSMDAAHPNLTVLYVGPDGTQLVTRRLEGIHVRDAGRLPADDVSVHLTAMDLHLAPFTDGVSTRRGSFMAGLQHGIPTVSTRGTLTDPMLAARDDEAFTLAPAADAAAFAEAAIALMQNPSQRLRMGTAGNQLYDEAFAFDVVAKTFFDIISDT
jgi:glycosyltransferase involved in cell wall biosynthesis